MSQNFAPRPYQQTLIDHIVRTPRCAVWAGMGMGKTVSALTALDVLRLAEDVPILVLAPLRVATQTWPDEAKKWSHTENLKIQPIVGSIQERLKAVATAADIYTTNYEQVPWLVEYWKNKWPYQIVVADESTKLKSFRTRLGGVRARALAKVAHAKVKRFIELTGTPSPNGLMDLWGQMWFLDCGQRLGRTFSAFVDRWFLPHPSGFGYIPCKHAHKEIQTLLSDICITVDPKDWFDLRQPITNNVYVDLPKKARAIYQDLEQQLFAQLESGEILEAANAASRTIKCLQLANGAIYTDSAWEEVHTVKLQALSEVIEEAAGAPVLVAYHFKSDLVRLQRAFPQGRELDKNPQTLRAWNQGEIPILFIHPSSAGHGLNLQDGGNILVFFGHWWNLEDRQQVTERIGPTRQAQAGYDRPVYIHNIIARDTVDELVIERINTKAEVQDVLLAAMKRRKGLL